MKVGKTELFNYLNSFLKAQCVCSLLHCFPGRLQQDSDTSYALSHPDLSLAPFRLSFSLLRASERLSTVSFNSLPRSRTLIIPFTPSGPPRKHSTQRSLARRTREGALCCPSDACSGYEHAQSLPSIEHCIKSSVMEPQCPAHLQSLHTVLHSRSSVHRLIKQGHVMNRQGYRKLNRFTCNS